MNDPTGNVSERELVLELVVDAPRDKVWRCWTEADPLRQWFTPRPWTVAAAELDVRPGGMQQIVMRSPEGAEFPNTGVYLEVVPNEKLVFTDAYASAWIASEKPFMTATVSFADDAPGKTRFHAHVTHWTAEDCESHRKMGFHGGWTAAARQLEEVAAGI